MSPPQADKEPRSGDFAPGWCKRPQGGEIENNPAAEDVLMAGPGLAGGCIGVGNRVK